MRYTSALFVVILLMLVSCTGSQDQLEPKSASSISITVEGAIVWDAFNPPDLLINVFRWNGLNWIWDTSFYAEPWDPDYSVGITLSVGGDDYMFQPVPPQVPDEYESDPTERIVENVLGSVVLSDMDFNLSEVL